VLLKVEERRVALAVSRVRGIHTLAATSLHALPPLLTGAQSELVSALSALDAQLLIVLESGRVVPEWSSGEPELLGVRA